jgi:hypothetical protein
MKTILKLFSVMLFLLFVPVFAISAQDPVPLPTGQLDLNSLFASFPLFCAGVVVITGLITAHIANLTSTWRSVLSWVIAAIIGFLGWWLKLGIFDGIDIIQVIFIIISFAVGSNVIYSVSWIRDLLAALKIVAKKSDPPK